MGALAAMLAAVAAGSFASSALLCLVALPFYILGLMSGVEKMKGYTDSGNARVGNAYVALGSGVLFTALSLGVKLMSFEAPAAAAFCTFASGMAGTVTALAWLLLPAGALVLVAAVVSYIAYAVMRRMEQLYVVFGMMGVALLVLWFVLPWVFSGCALPAG